MFRKVINTALLILLALAVIFISTSCQKLSINKLKANYHFTAANNNFSDNLYRKAIEEYELALSYNPDIVEAYRFLGESYKNLYKPGDESEENEEIKTKALDTLKKALEIDPTNKDIIFSLGDLYDKLGDFDNAEALYLSIIEMEPTHMDNYYVVAGFYKRYAGEKEEIGKKAEEMYLRRIETDPENPEGYAYLAQYYGEKRPMPLFDKSSDLYKKILELKPDDALTYYTIGVNFFYKAYRLQNVLSLEERKKLADESEKALMKSYELDKNYSFTYSYINMLYRNIHSKIYPNREKRYIAEADRWNEKFLELRKKEQERKKLERELRDAK